MPTKIIPVSQLKTTIAGVMAELEHTRVPVFVTQHGKPKAVLVSFEEYEALLSKLDDLEDALAMTQALAASEDQAQSLTEYERQRRAQVPG